MAQILPHLTRELERELSIAVEESNNGYPKHLQDLRDEDESITDDDVNTMKEALWEAACEGREALLVDDSAMDDVRSSPYTSTRYADEQPEADFYGEG